jgi:hypothetical protein
MTVEDKQAAIVRLTLANPGYSHAERVVARMVAYSQETSVEQAVDRLHAEVIDELAGSKPEPSPATGGPRNFPGPSARHHAC